MYTRQSWKVEGSMDMINTMFLTTVAVESNPFLLLFFIALANIRPGLSRAIHSNIRTERWTQNHLQYLSGLSSALPFPTASRNNCRLVYGLLRDRSLFISWSEKGWRWILGGITYFLGKQKGGSVVTENSKVKRGDRWKLWKDSEGGPLNIAWKMKTWWGGKSRKSSKVIRGITSVK